MFTLRLGVLDIPYQAQGVTPERGRRRPRTGTVTRQRARPASTTTGDVAQMLEAKYSLFSMFSVFRGRDITDALEEAMRGKLETLLMGGPGAVPGGPLFGEGELSAIESAFREFLDRREMDGRVPGVPTQAALAGVNHRLARPYARGNPARPSFIDTGQLQASFRAWID